MSFKNRFLLAAFGPLAGCGGPPATAKTPPLIGPCILLLVAASCAVGPDYLPPKPSQIAPADWHWKPAQPADAAPKGDWWNVFHDPVLASLETKGLPDNITLNNEVEQRPRVDNDVTRLGKRGK